MKPRAPIAPVILGLLLAVVTGVLLSEWFFAQAQDELLAQRQERAVVMQTMALAERVAIIEASTPDTSTAQLATLVRAWSARFPDMIAIRVVRSADAQFLASSDPQQAASLPRQLQREEKPLYDLGQELRANVETNAAEAVFRKKQIHIERVSRTQLRVAAPYAVAGDVLGFVQVEQRVAMPTLSLASVRIAAAILLPVLLLLFALRGRTSPPGKPWFHYGVAVLLLTASLYGEAIGGLADLNRWHERFAVELAQQFSDIKQTFDSTTAEIAGTPVADNHWDVDEYQRPRAIISVAGTINRTALAADLQTRTTRLVRSLWSSAVLSLALLSFATLGYAQRLWRTLIEHKTAYWYVTPAIAGMLVLVFFPFVYGVTLSFTDTTLFNENLSLRELWVGVKNYVAILGDFQVVRGTEGDWVVNYQNFYWTLFITIAWTVCNVAIGVSIGLALALALNTKGLRYTNIYRVLLILPWAIPNYITALTWRGMFHKQYGVINQVIQIFGGEPVSWFDSAFTSFVTGIATNGWLSFPFMMVITLGGLQSIPQSAYEAARVEGANRWQQFRHITLPYLKPTLIPAIIISVVWTFNMFNIIYLVSGGEPAGSNEILITQAYKIAFEKYQYGYAAAYSVVIFMILLVYGVFQNRVTRATEAIA
jgi:arabinogalactan oligomer / maltooligosaccharide transport system permease protein